MPNEAVRLRLAPIIEAGEAAPAPSSTWRCCSAPRNTRTTNASGGAGPGVHSSPSPKAILQRAIDILRQIVAHGRHRVHPRLIIAAPPRRRPDPAPHDRDFDLIAEVTKQPAEWVGGAGHRLETREPRRGHPVAPGGNAEPLDPGMEACAGLGTPGNQPGMGIKRPERSPPYAPIGANFNVVERSPAQRPSLPAPLSHRPPPTGRRAKVAQTAPTTQFGKLHEFHAWSHLETPRDASIVFFAMT